MSRARALFGHRFWVWATPLAVVVLGLLGILLYQVAFAGNAQVLRRSLDRQAQLLEDLRSQRQTVERFLEATRAQGDATNILFRDHLATEAERFTRALREVRQLAARSRLDPTSFVYPETPVEEYGLVKRGINFSVEGTYDQLRTFVNLLEITDQFIMLESVTLDGGANERNPTLNIRLGLGTYFVEDPDLIAGDDLGGGDLGGEELDEEFPGQGNGESDESGSSPVNPGTPAVESEGDDELPGVEGVGGSDTEFRGGVPGQGAAEATEMPEEET